MKRVICCVLFILLIFTGCADKTDVASVSSVISEVTEASAEIPLGESLEEMEEPFRNIIYSEDIVNSFGKDKHIALDSSKDNSVTILGDSISYGTGSGKVYNYSWSALFKYSVNDNVGTNNHGFVSLLDHSGLNNEIHTISAESGTWEFQSKVGYIPGFCAYYSPSGTGSTLLIKLDRRADGLKRSINGFYLHYLKAPGAGSFDVTVNGNKLTTVNTAGGSDYTARTDYISIPEGLDSEIEIRIAKKDANLVAITGISYAESNEGTTVNNYSLPGLALCDIDDSALENLSKTDYLVLSLGFNDAINSKNIEKFNEKLSVISAACIKNGTTLVVVDFLWLEQGTEYSAALSDAAAAADGYYIDLRALASVEDNPILEDHAHPNLFGCRLVARTISYFFSVPFCSEVK